MPVWHSPETRARVIKLIRSVTALRKWHRHTHIAVRLVAAAKSSAADVAVAAVADEIDRKGAESVAAVLMEPNAGTNGIVAPDNYWPGLREVTRSRGVFLIADEVMSAFGRCGEWFAWQRYGDAGKPDLMTLAKGLTGAHLPLGAVVMNENVARHLETQMLFTGLTYCGHPLACAAGLAAVRAYEDEKLIERSRRLGGEMFARIKAPSAKTSVDW